MAELIGALAEAIAGLVLIIAEALPAIAELLIYLALSSATLIAYALSRGFRERKRREWTERPRRRYLDIGFSAVSLTMLALLALWIFLPSAKPSKGPVHSTAAPAQSDANFELMIGKRSDQDSNRVTMQVRLKKGALSKLLQRKSREKPNAMAQVPVAGVAVVTNETNTIPRNASTNLGSSP